MCSSYAYFRKATVISYNRIVFLIMKKRIARFNISKDLKNTVNGLYSNFRFFYFSKIYLTTSDACTRLLSCISSDVKTKHDFVDRASRCFKVKPCLKILFLSERMTWLDAIKTLYFNSLAFFSFMNAVNDRLIALTTSKWILNLIYLWKHY